MRKIRIKRPQRNPHCAYHYGGHCMNPAHDHYSGAYGMYGAALTVEEAKKVALPKMYNIGGKYDPVYIRLLAAKLATFPMKIGAGGAYTAGKYAVSPGDKYTKELADVVKIFQEEMKLGIDGLVGRSTWKKLGVEADGWKLPAASTSSSSSGSTTSSGTTSSGGSTGGSSNQGGSVSITDKVWFWPVVGVGGLGLLVVLLKMMKGKKKKKRSSATGSAATPLRGTQASVAGMRRNRF